MRPNFALSLSSDGIVLLRRTATGWQNLGNTDPSSPKLSKELAVLRRTATALEPSGIHCKLLIPHDQIRFLSISTPEMDIDARREAVRDALDGATPYAVSELRFDLEQNGDETHVAAVAIETLEEAERFAVNHRLHPVSFGASDEGAPFTNELFFGETSFARELLAPGEEVEREVAKPSTETHDVKLRDEVEEDTQWSSDVEDRTEPSFVSRRRVPTFRTEASPPLESAKEHDDALEGFSEAPADFKGMPLKSKPATKSPAPPKKLSKAAPAGVGRDPRKPLALAYQTDDTRTEKRGVKGLILLISVVLLAGLAAFANGALGISFSDLLTRLMAPKPQVQFTAPQQPSSLGGAPQATENAPELVVVAVDPDITDEDAAVLDALRTPLSDAPEPNTAPNLQDSGSAYVVSGIWSVAPDVPSPPPLIVLEDLYVTGVDPTTLNFDAVALPAVASDRGDLAYASPLSPAPAGTQFDLNAQGLVVARPDGTMTPDGIMVFAGAPPAKPPENIVKIQNPGEDLNTRIKLAGFRPQLRPTELIEAGERASASLVPLDGNGNRSLLEQPAENDFDGATNRAVVASLRPDARPNDFGTTVAKIRDSSQQPLISSTANAPATPEATVAPRITRQLPSSASASREATTENALNLRKINLIGVYGKPSNRSALVRLGNGRYRKVQVGDRIDGGEVVAIGDAELRYQKRGRALVLTMPRG